MAIKLFVDSLDDVNESLRDEYVENPQGGFMLTFEEKLVPERRLTDLQKKIEQYKTWKKPEEYSNLEKQLQENLKKIEELSADTDVESKVSSRVGELKAEWETEKTSLLEKINHYQVKEERSILRDAVTNAATKLGVRSSAIEDVLLRSSNVFKVVDGKLKAFDNEGNEKFFKGDKEYTPESWLNEIKPVASHLFEDTVGGGAIGGTKPRPTHHKATSARDLIQQGLTNTGA